MTKGCVSKTQNPKACGAPQSVRGWKKELSGGLGLGSFKLS